MQTVTVDMFLAYAQDNVREGGVVHVVAVPDMFPVYRCVVRVPNRARRQTAAAQFQIMPFLPESS